MARIRSVHPKICESEDLVDVPAEVERTFVRLWTHCDDDGRAKDNPRLIKAAIYPLLDDMTALVVDDHLDELAKRDLIVRYEVEGVRYLSIPSWGRWQHPQKKRTSEIPAPDDAAPVDVRDQGDSPTRQAPEGLVPVVGVGEGEGVGEETPVPPEPSTALELVAPDVSPSATDPASQVFEAWIEAAGKTGRTVLTPERRRLIQKQLKNYPLADVIDAVRGWRHSAHHRGENDRGTVYNDLELVLRDAKHVEMFRDLERNPPAAPLPRGMRGIADWLQRVEAS